VSLVNGHWLLGEKFFQGWFIMSGGKLMGDCRKMTERENDEWMGRKDDS
jgi:hypothetical protein